MLLVFAILLIIILVVLVRCIVIVPQSNAYVTEWLGQVCRMGGGLCVGGALGYHQVALGVLGVGVAGRQGKQVAARLYQHGVYVVRLYNF